jgi:hypothetical protein
LLLALVAQVALLQALEVTTALTEIILKYLVVDLQQELPSEAVVVDMAVVRTPEDQVLVVATVPKVARLLLVKAIQEVRAYLTVSISGLAVAVAVLEKLELLQVLLRQVQVVQELHCHGSRHQ